MLLGYNFIGLKGVAGEQTLENFLYVIFLPEGQHSVLTKQDKCILSSVKETFP